MRPDRLLQSRLVNQHVSPTAFVWELLAVDTDSLPWLAAKSALPLAERVHRALVKLAGQGHQVDCPELTGQADFAQPLSCEHHHAHVLPVDVNDDGTLDHVLLHAPMGFGNLAQSAIHSLHSIYGPGGSTLCSIRLTHSNRLQHLLQADQGDDTTQRAIGAHSWQSLTPFIPPRFLKKSGKNSLEGQVQAELASRNLPHAEHVELQSDLSLAMRGFQRARSGDAARPPQDVGFALKLTFSQHVMGPICLGYASHFGAGLFQTRRD